MNTCLKAKNAERAAIEAQLAAFLASGGIVQHVSHRKVDVKPWTLTDLQAKQLRTIGELAKHEQIMPLDMETLSLSDGFPQAFSYRGQVRYTLASWNEWKEKNAAQVNAAKRRFKR